MSALEGPGLESRQGREIYCSRKPPRPAAVPTESPTESVLPFFVGVKRLGREADHSPPSGLRMSGALPLLPLFAFMPLTGTIVSVPYIKYTMMCQSNTTKLYYVFLLY